MHQKTRYHGLDQLRGIGVVLMIIFHFCYDLNAHKLGIIPLESRLFWYWLPRLIVFIFLVCVGISLRLAHFPVVKWKAFFTRFGLIAGSALCISVVTFFIFPKNWVYFGTLHCIALCSLAAIPFLKIPKISLILSILILAPVLIFDYRYPWINLNPKSMDYEPFLPWFYVCLLGIFIESTNLIGRFYLPKKAGGEILQYLGKKALIIYLIHQPILFGLTALLAKILR